MIPDTIKIVKSLDWLTATFPVEWSEMQKTSKYDWTLPYGKGFNVVSPGRKFGYYKSSHELECGGTLQFSENTSSVKPHAMLNLTGENMNYLHQHNQQLTDDKLISWVHINAQNVTRLDFAIDIYNAGSVPEFLEGCKSREIKTRGKIINYEAITGKRGHTVYVGAETSELRMRVYDKAAQTGNYDSIWTRIELQARGDYAMALKNDMNNKSVAVGGTERINKFCDATCLDWWDYAIDSRGVPSSGYKQTDANWREWALNTVLPSLLAHSETDEDILMIIMRTLQGELKHSTLKTDD